MPLREPELSEPYYSGDFYELGYGSEGFGAAVEYRYTEDDGYAYDPDAGEVEWLSDPVTSGPDVNWSNDAEKRKVGEAILNHHFRRAPTEDELDLFMVEVAPTLKHGIPFAVEVEQLRAAGLQQ